MYDLTTKTFLNRDDALKVISDLGLEAVPEVYAPFPLAHSVDELVIMSMIKSKINPEVWAEGIVFRPVVEGTERGLGRFSFKVINPEYQLKHKI